LSTYGDSFYRDLDATAAPSARRIVPLLLELAALRSAVDIGCGDGGWLSVLAEHGVSDILGLDGPWVPEARLKIPVASFRRARLDAPLAVERRFDLAISLEVAEHLPPERAADFVRALTALAPLVLFSAAIPGQGGVDHLNEQWPSYWAGLFAGRDFRAIDIVRATVWNDPQVTWWYKQNILLYAAPEALARHPRLAAAAAAAPPEPLPLVHPELFAQARRRAEPGFGRWLKMLPGILRRRG
jgi:SAM-dependent methyltransferase